MFQRTSAPEVILKIISKKYWYATIITTAESPKVKLSLANVLSSEDVIKFLIDAVIVK